MGWIGPRCMATALNVLFLSASTGCIQLVGEVPREKPDPLIKQAVKIASASGAMVTLADGRTFQLAGVDLAGLTAEQRASVDQTLDQALERGTAADR